MLPKTVHCDSDHARVGEREFSQPVCVVEKHTVVKASICNRLMSDLIIVTPPDPESIMFNYS